MKGHLGAVLALVFAANIASSDERYSVVDAPAGQKAKVYFSRDTTGSVYIKLAQKSGNDACAEFWWVKWQWPLGEIENLGLKCGTAKFRIPGGKTYASELNARSTTGDLKILATKDADVRNRIELSW